jgi:hypothetical protein
MQEQERTVGIPVGTSRYSTEQKSNQWIGKRDCGEHTEVQVDGLVVFCTVNTRTDRLLQRKSQRVERGVGVSCWRCKE